MSHKSHDHGCTELKKNNFSVPSTTKLSTFAFNQKCQKTKSTLSYGGGVPNVRTRRDKWYFLLQTVDKNQCGFFYLCLLYFFNSAFAFRIMYSQFFLAFTIFR